MTDKQLKLATQEILALGFRDNGEVITYDEKMDMVKTLESIIPQLNNKDYFTSETKEVLAEMGWTREKAPDPDAVVTEPAFVPEEVTVDKTLEQEIEFCEKLKDLKELARSEPAFKSIRGKLDSFDLDSLKLEMYRILNPEAYKKPSPVEAFEAEGVQVKDNIEQIYAEEASRTLEDQLMNDNLDETNEGLDELANLPDELGVIPKDQVKDYYNHYHGEKGMIPVKQIVKKEPFVSLFEINPNTLNDIKVSMRVNGYDSAFPVILWGNILVDGFTRTKAAENAGIEAVPFEMKEFKDEHEALEYAMHNQRDRRNISEAELLRCISVIDTPMSKTDAGAVRGEKKEASHKKTAKLLGIGESKVTDARTVLTNEQATEDVKNAKKTMHEAAEEIRSRKRKPKETIAEALTKVESIIQVLKDNAGKEMKLGLLLKQSESLGVKEDMMSLIMEVLTAVNLVKISGDKLSIKKAIK